MGDGDDRTLILAQMLLQPLDTLGVQMVGRLVEQEYVRLAQQKAAQSHATTLASAESSDSGFGGRALEGIHGSFELGVQLPSVAVLYFLRKLTLTLDEFVHLVIRHGFSYSRSRSATSCTPSLTTSMTVLSGSI